MTVYCEEIRKQLESLAEPDFQQFTAKLIPNIPSEKILGVRLPKLRKIAKKIAKDHAEEYLKTASDQSYEEIMLQGMVIGYLKEDLEKIQAKTARFVKKIDNWSVCDSFCSGLKITKNHKEEMWQFIQPYLKDQRTYYIRFGIVMMIFYFIEETYLEDVLKKLDQIQQSDYYVKMAEAWAVSICYVRFPQRTLQYLKENGLDDFTYNKSLQKIIESQKTDPETKRMIRSLKR